MIGLKATKVSELNHTDLNGLIPKGYFAILTRFNGFILKSKHITNKAYQTGYKELLKLNSKDSLEVLKVKDSFTVTDILNNSKEGLFFNRTKRMLGGMVFTHHDDPIACIYNEWDNEGILLTLIIHDSNL